jgi:glycosyltransferase involved in cell wall biosynthesis
MRLKATHGVRPRARFLARFAAVSDPRRQPLKIMHLITGLRRAGAEGMLLKLLQHRDRERMQAVVVVLSGEDALADDIRAAGVPVHVLGIGGTMGAIAALPRLIRLVRSERPDLLQSWLYQADFAGLLLSYVFPEMSLVWNLRSTRVDGGDFPLRTRMLPRVLARASRRPHAVIANSEAGRRDHVALGYHPRRWIVLPNGFDLDRFRPDPERRSERRARLGASERHLLVGMIARVDPMKNHAGFLDAAIDVAAALPEARFVLVGRDTEMLRTPDALAGKVQALGERDDVAEILPALDLIVLPSRYAEGFPNVLGEAMASGVPCVATDVGDAATIIADTGVLVPAGDDRALARAITRFLDQSEEARARAGEAARRRIAAEFSIDTVARRYEELYRGILEQAAVKAA